MEEEYLLNKMIKGKTEKEDQWCQNGAQKETPANVCHSQE